MTAEAPSQILTSLESAERADFPYPHMVVPQLLAEHEAEEMLQWLETGASWWEQHRDFYTHLTCDNMLECPLLRDGQPLSRAIRSPMRSISSCATITMSRCWTR